MKYRIITGIVFALFLFVATEAILPIKALDSETQENVIADGGFEYGTLEVNATEPRGYWGVTPSYFGADVHLSTENVYNGTFSLYINGTVDTAGYVYQHFELGTNAYTFSFWAYRVTGDGFNQIIAAIGTDWKAWWLPEGYYNWKSASYFMVRDRQVYFGSSGAVDYYLTPSEWHHIVIVNDPSQKELYIDGKFIMTDVGSSIFPDVILSGDTSFRDLDGAFYIDDISLVSGKYPEAPIPKTLSIKLAGELSYLDTENIPIRLAALVKDSKTLEPVSGANVTLKIYDSEGNLWVSDNMTERLSQIGIYEWVSNQTIAALNIEKGVYLVYVEASYAGGPKASDIIELHIDPPPQGTTVTPTEINSLIYYAIIALLAANVGVMLLKRFIHTRS